MVPPPSGPEPGEGVRFRAGDLVWGLMPHGTFGAIAERVVVPRDRLAALQAGLDPAVAGPRTRRGRRAEESARLLGH